MKIERVRCDVGDCPHENATHVSTFSRRLRDGVGDTVDMDFTMDLCPQHQNKLLYEALKALGPEQSERLFEKVCINFVEE